MDDIHIPDVKDIYFQHKILRYVIGQPHIGSHWELVNELKASASIQFRTLNMLLAI